MEYKSFSTTELVRFLQNPKINICPYHFTKYIINKVNLLLCPYNYVINPRIRKLIGLDIENAIVIFDEAHNIENQAEDSCSLDLS